MWLESHIVAHSKTYFVCLTGMKKQNEDEYQLDRKSHIIINIEAFVPI